MTQLGRGFGGEPLASGVGPSWAQAQALKVTQIVSGATCLALVAYGIIDALAYHEPVTVSERWIKRKPNKEKKKREEEQNKSSLLLAPMVGPNTAGLNMGFSF